MSAAADDCFAQREVAKLTMELATHHASAEPTSGYRNATNEIVLSPGPG